VVSRGWVDEIDQMKKYPGIFGYRRV